MKEFRFSCCPQAAQAATGKHLLNAGLRPKPERIFRPRVELLPDIGITQEWHQLTMCKFLCAQLSYQNSLGVGPIKRPSRKSSSLPKATGPVPIKSTGSRRTKEGEAGNVY